MSALAQRYAAALADVALQRGGAETLRSDLADFAGMLARSTELRNFLASPAVPRQAKQTGIAEIIGRMKAHAELRNFLFLLVDHGRIGRLEEIRQAFDAELNRRMGILEAEVASAHELAQEEKAELTRTLERVTGKRIEARFRMDPGLIGGATVRIGSTIYDGSVREQLNRLRAQLEAQ